MNARRPSRALCVLFLLLCCFTVECMAVFVQRAVQPQQRLDRATGTRSTVKRDISDGVVTLQASIQQPNWFNGPIVKGILLHIKDGLFSPKETHIVAIHGVEKSSAMPVIARSFVGNNNGYKIMEEDSLVTCGMRPNQHTAQVQRKMSFARVVAGEESTSRWPWQVMLLNKTSKEPFCGGTLISKRHIVTAAHCFDGRNMNDILIVLGEHDRTRHEGTEQEFDIDCIHVHRRYVSRVPYNNDIAVVKLKTFPDHDVLITDFVMPACMPDKNEFKAGDDCYITGWGYTNFIDRLLGKKPHVLNEAKLPILGNNKCRQAYGAYISKKMTCAGYIEGVQRADTCQVDSGGPLMCQKDGVWKLFGITSWGQNSFCNPSPTDAVPGVYTRVDRYRSWVQSRIQMDSCPSRR